MTFDAGDLTQIFLPSGKRRLKQPAFSSSRSRPGLNLTPLSVSKLRTLKNTGLSVRITGSPDLEPIVRGPTDTLGDV